MRKIVLTACSAICLLFMVSIPFVAEAQDCVDYDKARYPITIDGKSYEWNPIWNFTNLKQIKRTGLNVGTYFKGLLEYLPASYNAQGNEAKKYPVIIFFHGYASRGTGSAAELCKLFKDKGSDLATHLSIPGRVERSTSAFTQPSGETTQEFIVISPQFDQYARTEQGNTVNDKFPSGNEVEENGTSPM